MAEQGQASKRPLGKLKSSAEIKASNANVVQQAKLLDSAGTAWHAVKYGNLEMITRLFPSQCNVYMKGPVGDNVFHIALLLNTPSTLAIAKYLVKLYGKTLVNTPYQERKHELDAPGQYEGETALHIAIVNRDFDMVKFLIQAGAEIRARCWGAFFQQGSAVYYGEYPLSFAASTGQKDIVSYLKRHGARVNHDCDMYGNTALHLAVYHDQLDMYDHLVEYCGAVEHVRNNRGATPLLLAATLGKLEVFQHIYNKRRQVAWAYGPVTSYSLSLHEIDSVQNSLRSFVPSAIETIIRKGHMHMIDDPLVGTLLTSKWQRFAAAQFLGQAGMHLVLVLVQTFLVWLHCSSKNFNSSSRQALEIVSLILAVLLFIVEVIDLCTWTLGVRHRRRLMKANTKYCPALYPIPGDQAEIPVKPKSAANLFGASIISRMMGKSGVAVAEGAQDTELGRWHVDGQGPMQVHVQGDEGLALAAGNPWWGDAAALGEQEVQASGVQLTVRRQQPTAGPVSEATGYSVGGDDVDDDDDRQDGSGDNIRAMRPAHAATASKAGARLAPPPPDFVSIGYGGMQPAAAASQRAPSFFVQPPASLLARPPTDSGLGASGLAPSLTSRPDEGLKGMVPGAPQQFPGMSPVPEGRPSGNRVSISSIRSSLDSGRPSTEIRNRIRGGGGGDYQANGSITRRVDSKPADDKEQEEQETDTRVPLHVGGFRGQVRTLIHSLVGYYSRQITDPITLLMLCHVLLTLIHFITWATAYGGVGGAGPDQQAVSEFDDIILALVALSGWTSLLYFARGLEFSGQLAVMIELCVVEVLKYASIYAIFNIGYALAFYALINGVTFAASGTGEPHQTLPQGAPGLTDIGTNMIQLIRFMYGEADYATFTSTNAYRSKQAVATCLFILYIGTVLLLLVNLFTAIILHTYNSYQGHAQKVWRLRWASYVLRAEARMPLWLQQRFRLGVVSYDPALGTRVYNHVFEVVEDGDKNDDRDKEAKALEAALDRVRKGGNSGAGKK